MTSRKEIELGKTSAVHEVDYERQVGKQRMVSLSKPAWSRMARMIKIVHETSPQLCLGPKLNTEANLKIWTVWQKS